MSLWLAGAALASTGANIAYSEYKDADLKKQNKNLQKSYDKQIAELSSSIEGIEKYSEGLVEMEQEGSGLRSEDMFLSFLSKSEDLTEDYQRDITGANMAYSGTVEESSKRDRALLGDKLDIGQTEEALRTEKNLLGILTSKEDSLASVRNQIYSLESAKAGLRT